MNRVFQLDLKQLMMMELGLSNQNETCGVEDPLLWVCNFETFV